MKNTGILPALALGAVAGMRTFTAPAALAYKRRQTGSSSKANRRLGVALGVAALAELVGDKLPQIPARISPPSLTGRALSGAYSGALAGGEERGRRIAGALLGALAAVGAAYGMYHLRRFVVARTHLPDAVVAVAEDTAAVALAFKAAA